MTQHLSSDPANTPLLKKRLDYLIAANSKKNQQNSVTPIPIVNPNVDLPHFVGDNRVYDIKLGDGWNMRITPVGRPSIDQPLGTGISVREVYPPNTTEKARLTLTYYQAWPSGQFSFSDDLYVTLRQLECQLCNSICRNRDSEPTSYYRLPNCVLFLRFYDETELAEDRLQAHRLLHIPFCYVLDTKAWSMPDFKNVLDEDGLLYTHSIPDWMFGELFHRKMVGSTWLDHQSLKYTYDVLRSCLPKEVFIIHSQIYKQN